MSAKDTYKENQATQLQAVDMSEAAIPSRLAVDKECGADCKLGVRSANMGKTMRVACQAAG